MPYQKKAKQIINKQEGNKKNPFAYVSKCW